jgi:hypothetical protein
MMLLMILKVWAAWRHVKRDLETGGAVAAGCDLTRL